MLKRVLLALVLLFPTTALAQRCLSELAQGLAPAELAATASAEDAAGYLRQATELLEPGLPILLGGADTYGLLPTDAAFDDVFYLASRELLPPSWRPGELSVELWQDMLESLAALYDRPAPNISATVSLTHARLIGDLSTLIDLVAPTLKPVALVAASEQRSGKLGFVAVVRNDTVYPRLIVMRSPEERFDLSGGIESLLPQLETCAMTLKNFISAREDTATRLYLANNDARMVVVSADHLSYFAPHWVEAGEEIDYLRFAHPYTAAFERFSVVFVGPGPGMMTILRIVPQLRTNMDPREIVDFILD
jgi:hypothetical protein